MPVKGRTDAIQIEKAFNLCKEMVSTKNQADFSEIAEAIIRKFGGADGIAGSLFLLFQSARGWKQQKEVLELVVKVASRKAEMSGGNFDALDKAIPLLSDDDLEQTAIGIMTRVMERKGILSVDALPTIGHSTNRGSNGRGEGEEEAR